MPANNNSIYVGRDIQGIRNELIELVKSETDKWTDFNESDVGMVFIELAAAIGDYLGFYLDKQALESFIRTVKQRKNGAGILELINYKMHMANASIATGKFTLPETYSYDIDIPRYTQVSGPLSRTEKIYYATEYDTTVKAGETEVELPILQGIVTKSSITVGELRESQRLRIYATDIALGSMIVEIDGVEWTEVPDVVIDDVAGPKYSLFEDKHTNPYLLFHNNYRDYLPVDNTIRVNMTYLVTLGSQGKIKEGLINHIESWIADDAGFNIASKIAVTNTTVSSGGADRETLEHAKIQAPQTLTVMNKAIVLDDFRILAENDPGVLKAQALDWSVDGSGIVIPYYVELYIVPTDGGDASPEQLLRVKNIFDEVTKLSSVQVATFTAEYVVIDVKAEVFALVTDNEVDNLKQQIEDRVRTYFEPKNMDFASGVYRSNIITLIETTATSIDHVNLDLPAENLNLKLSQFPQLGTLDITVTKISYR